MGAVTGIYLIRLGQALLPRRKEAATYCQRVTAVPMMSVNRGPGGRTCSPQWGALLHGKEVRQHGSFALQQGRACRQLLPHRARLPRHLHRTSLCHVADALRLAMRAWRKIMSPIAAMSVCFCATDEPD